MRTNQPLHGLWAVFKQELSLYFATPLVYLIGAVWFFFAGGFFSLTLYNINMFGGELTLAGVLSVLVYLMIFIGPALTMKLLSDEYRAGTHEILFTSPIHDWEIVVGKWLASFTVFTLFMAISFIFPIILIIKGNPDITLILTGYLGLWLMAGAVLAIGTFASSLTQYQLVSFMIGFGILLFLWLSEIGASLVNNQTVKDAFSQLSLISHYESLIARAVIDPVDLAYFIGIMILSLFMSTQVLSTRRWNA